MSRIAIDCDGVLADFNGAALKIARRLFPGKYPADFVPQEWDWWGNDASAVWAEIDKTTNWWLTLGAYQQEVHDFVKFLMQSKTSHEVWIVTARHNIPGSLSVAKQTELWWKTVCDGSNHASYVGVIDVLASNQKAELYRDIEIAYSVDDKGETVEECDTVGGHKAFLLNRPWNQHVKVRNRIDNLAQMFDTIKE